jgi:thioredoxin 1
MAALHFDINSFNSDVLQSDIPVLVDFWAQWCGPCKMIAPIIEQLSDELAGKVKVGKVDVDENPNIAMEYGVMSIPTVIVFRNGKPAEKSIGLRQKDELKKLLGL